MTAVFEYSGLKLAAGLEWSDLSTINEAKKFAGKEKSFVIKKDALSEKYTLGCGDLAAAKDGAFSAGLVIGKRFPMAFIYEQLPGGVGTWICVIHEGAPFPGHDLVVADENTAKEVYTQFSRFADANAEKIGNRTGFNHSLEEAIQIAVESAISPEGAKRKLKPAKALADTRLQIKRFNWLAFALSVVGLCAVSAVALFVWIYRNDLLDQQRRAVLLEETLRSQQAQVEIAAKRKAALDAFNQEVIAAQREFGTAGVLEEQWAACEEIRNKLPLSYMGYEPKKLSCDFAKSEAEVEWMPINQTTRVIHRFDIPGVVDKYKVEDPVIAKHSLQKKYNVTKLAPQQPEVVRLKIMDWAAQRMRSLKLDAISPITISPSKDLQEAALAKVTKIGDKANFSMSGTGHSEVLSVKPTLHYLNDFLVEIVGVVWTNPTGQGSSVRIQGVFYFPVNAGAGG